MSKDFSPISKLMGIVFLIIVIVAMFNLAYDWSMEQTQDFMSAVVGSESSMMAAYLIQFTPQALLIIAAVAKMNGKHTLFYSLIVASIAVNFLDWYTNDITFREWWPTWSQALIDSGRSKEFIEATRPVGRFLTFLVTWFEEGISLALGAMLQLLAELMEGLGYRPPQFFRSGIVAAAGGDFRGVSSGNARASSGNTKQPSPRAVNTKAQPRQRDNRAKQRQTWSRGER